MTKTTKEVLGFDDRWLMLFGIPIVSFLVSALMFGDSFEERFLYNLSKCSLISIIYTAFFWVAFRQITIYFRRRFPLLSDAQKRLILQGISVFIAYWVIKTSLHFMIDEYIHQLLGLPNSPNGVAMFLASITLAFMILTLYEGIYFYSALQKSVLEKEQLARENVQSQLEGLKNQVNPHFLFNSLNTLTYIIPENSELAVRFVQKLSKVYRYILEIGDRKLISMKEELGFLNAYIFLLKERFGDNLQVEVNIPDSYLNRNIVPLSLQILIENAIKHNIISSLKPLHIEVFVEKDKLIIKNNLQRKNQVMNSTKVGLQNIKNRYRFFSEKKVEVLATADSFIVILPLLEMKESVLK